MASNDEQSFIIDDEVSKAKLAVTRIKGAKWIFVTVYPHDLMASAALKTVYIVAVIGLLSLLIELVFLFRVLRKQVLGPVKDFDDFTRRFAAREMNSIEKLAHSSVNQRRDEMGLLAQALIGMARSIEKYETGLNNIVFQRTEELNQTNKFLRQESSGRKRITTLLQSIATDVSGL